MNCRRRSSWQDLSIRGWIGMTSRLSKQRSIAIGLVGAVLLGASGLASCTTNRILVLSPAPSASPAAPRIPISGYVTAVGVHHDFQGSSEGRGVSLGFVIPARDRGLERPVPERVVIVHRDSIRSLDRKVTDYPRTVVATALLAAVFGTFAWLTFSSPSIQPTW
jgi:hypothetical protein